MSPPVKILLTQKDIGTHATQSGLAPIPVVSVILHHFVMGRVRGGGIVVGELAGSRQAYEDALGASVGLKSESGASVMEQVELDITSPAMELKIFVRLTVGGVLAFVHYGKIGGNEGLGEGLDHVTILLQIAAVVVIKKNASDAPPFSLSVFVGEITGTVLEPGIPASPGPASLSP